MITLDSLVKEARHLEMEYYDKMHAFDKVLVAQSWERTGVGSTLTKDRDIEADG